MDVVVFEELRASHNILLVWHWMRGDRMFYLSKGPGLRGEFASCLVRWSGIRPLTDKPLVYIRANASGDLAFQAIDKVYEVCFKNHPQIRELIDRFQSDDVHLVFQKILVEELERFYYYDLLFRRIAETFTSDVLVKFIPSSAARMRSIYDGGIRSLLISAGLSLEDAPDVMFPSWCRALAALEHMRQRCRGVVSLLYHLAASCVGHFRRDRIDTEAEFGITIMSPLREFYDDVNGIGFMLDGKRITSANTLFIAQCWLSRKDLSDLRQRGFRYITLGELRLRADSRVLIGCLGTIVGLAWKGPEWMLRAALVAAKEFASWTGVLAKVRLRHLVTYCDYEARHIPRNILLKKAGIQTWYYADTTNQSANWGSPQYCLAYWGFLLYDNYVAWNRANAAYQRKHKQHVGRYWENGVLWAESVRLVCEGKIVPQGYQQLQDKVKALSGGDKVLAVFDSTFDDNTVTGYSQAVAFAQDIHRLLCEQSALTVIFKEKKSRGFHQGRQDRTRLEEIYAILDAHPRCFMVGPHVSRTIVTSLADLTISFPFTSTTLEALGARRKAIFYDATRDFMSGYYANIPGLTVHGYTELRARVEELLFQVSDEAYWNSMGKELKDKIDPYLDGFGMTRFRALLAGEAQ